MTIKSKDNFVATLAAAAGYSESEIRAGLMFSDRKSRRTNPPGSFDRAGRFEADERTNAVRTCRTPSRSFPYSEMNAARTAAHCAEVCGAESLLAVKRVAKARDVVDDESVGISMHESIELVGSVMTILKRVERKMAA